jgi:hypothetical protein
MVNNEKETWQIKGRKVQISRSGSGQMENDIFKIRILWSVKLGMQLQHTFKTEKDAEAFARKITQKGVIRPEFWEKTFHPHSGWASAHYSD